MKLRQPLLLAGVIVLVCATSFAATQTITAAKYLGVKTLSGGPQPAAVTQSSRTLPVVPKPRFGPNPTPLAITPSTTVTGVPIFTPGAQFHGFNGMTALTSGVAQGFTLEPPDQGLGVSTTQVVEAINLSLAVYSRDGSLLAGPVSFYTLFGLDPNTQFLSDPRVFFDQDTHRWFLTILDFALDAKGNFAPPAFTLVAVSQQSNAIGNYFAYAFNVTDSSHAGCPCFGDQPLVGFNSNGIFMSTNEASFASFSFVTALILATDKYALANGHPRPVVALQNLSGGGMPGFSLQPANRAAGTSTSANGGTEYLVSSLNPEGYADNRVEVWALTNTGSLETNSPSLSLKKATVTTETYIQTYVVPQKSGPTPLRAALNAQYHNNDPLETLSPGDDRMQQVIYAGGKLYAALTTTLLKPTGGFRNGIAWVVIEPNLGTTGLTGSVAAQGYLAAHSAYLMYPAIAVNSAGQGVIGFSMSAAGMYPSVGYAKFYGTYADDEIYLAFPGAAPEDGFSGYYEFGGNGVARWGDYSAATIAPDGSAWFAAEYIPNLPRTKYTNFGTGIGSVHTP